MASTDALPVPRKNAAYRLTFGLFKSDGTLITGATGLDSEVSKDAGTFADCTNEATEIATSSGIYYLDLTDTEMNADTVCVLVKSSSTGAVPVVITLYPQEADDIRVNATYLAGTAQTGRDIGASVLLSSGTGTGQVSLSSGRVNADVVYVNGAGVNTAEAQLGVNVVQVSGSGTAADNEQLFFDGTGYAGGTTPLQVVLTTSGKEAVADQVWDEDITSHRATNSAGMVMQPMHTGVCQNGGNGTTVVLATGAVATDDYYNGDLILGWVTADGTGRFSDYISDYVGSTRTATVTGIPVSPDATYSYAILPGGSIPGATAPSASEVADAVWDEAMSGHTTEGTYGNAVWGEISHEGTLQSAASVSSVILDATGSSSTNNLYKYQRFEIVAGTGAGQASYISGYVGASKTVTLDPPLAVLPDNTSRYVIRKLGLDAATTAQVADAVWDEARSGHTTAGTFGEYVNADTVRLSGDATAADNLEAAYDGAGYAGGTIKPLVVLADAAHGGSAATLTARKLTVSNSTNGDPAIAITASGTGNAHGVAITASGAGKGVAIGAVGVGLSIDSSAADAVTIQGGTDSDGLQIAGNGTGVDIRADITGDITGNLSGSAGSVTGAVGSVTGAVGSVTGNVGGNVVGSVGSVTGAVGSVTGAVASVTGAVGSVTAPVTVGTNNDKTGYALSNTGIDALFTRQLTEAYAADGAAPTVTQALMLIQQMLGDFEISGTTLTVKKVNGSTTAATFTLNDGTTPTGITRSG